MLALGGLLSVCLCSVAVAQLNTGNMRDLGYPEPNWYPIVQGNASDKAVTLNPATQVWGNIAPYTNQANATLCKWSEGQENGGRGSCKTDLSYIHSAVGLAKEVFDDDVVNYVLRFQIEGACYRSTQYSDNDAAQYCAPWWWDIATNQKINTTHICYEITQMVLDPFSNQQVERKWGCAHKAPVAGFDFGPSTMQAPPATAPTAAITQDAATAPPGTVNVTSAPANTTTAPAVPTRKLLNAGGTTDVAATVPSAAAAPPPVAPTAAAPGPAEPDFPTAGEDPNSVDSTGAVSQGKVIDGRDDFLLPNIYSAGGLEFFDSRNSWYACHQFTLPGTVSRETCYREAFGINFGLNAVALRSMLNVMRRELAGCSSNFAANGATQGATSNKDWCEVDTSNWIVNNVLPANNITGTPAQPQSLDPTMTAPPPPPPPPPPFPPPPFAPPLAGGFVANDVFAPATPGTQSARGNGTDVNQNNGAGDLGGFRIVSGVVAAAAAAVIALV